MEGSRTCFRSGRFSQLWPRRDGSDRVDTLPVVATSGTVIKSRLISLLPAFTSSVSGVAVSVSDERELELAAFSSRKNHANRGS